MTPTDEDLKKAVIGTQSSALDPDNFVLISAKSLKILRSLAQSKLNGELIDVKRLEGLEQLTYPYLCCVVGYAIFGSGIEWGKDKQEQIETFNEDLAQSITAHLKGANHG